MPPYDGWLASPVRAESSSRLDELLTEPPRSEAYDVLVLVHEDLVPPDSLDGYSEKEIQEW